MISVNKATMSQLPPPIHAGNQLGNSNQADAAPIGEGIWILIALAASYGLNRYIRKMEVSPDAEVLQLSAEDIYSQSVDSTGLEAIKKNEVPEKSQTWNPVVGAGFGFQQRFFYTGHFNWNICFSTIHCVRCEWCNLIEELCSMHPVSCFYLCPTAAVIF